MRHLVLPLACAALLAGCSTTPVVTRERTNLSPKQIADMGLVCREMTPIDSNVPKTMCASQTTWDAYDRKQRRATEELLAEGRKGTNVGRYNRDFR